MICTMRIYENFHLTLVFLRAAMVFSLIAGHMTTEKTLRTDDVIMETEITYNTTAEAVPSSPFNITNTSQRDRRQYVSQFLSEHHLPFPSRPSLSPGQPSFYEIPHTQQSPPPPLATFRYRPLPIQEPEIALTNLRDLPPGPLFRDDEKIRTDEKQQPSTETPPSVTLLTVSPNDDDEKENFDETFPTTFRRLTPPKDTPVYISTVAPPQSAVTPESTLLSQLQVQLGHPNSSPQNYQQRLSTVAPPPSIGGEHLRYLNGDGEDPEQQGQAETESVKPITSAVGVPRITDVLIQCSMTSMKVNIEFDRPFDGVVYSRGFFNDPRCHYVPYDSGPSRKFEFVVDVNRCGARFVAPEPASISDNQPHLSDVSSLEDELVIQNEPGIQEKWDTGRHLRCTWSGTLRRTVQSALRVNVLRTESVSRSADTADARLDVQQGRGPFAEPVTGLVEIGDTLTLVVAVFASGVDDVRVRECVARDGNGLSVPLSDIHGCILRPKLLSPWSLTRDTGRTGASMLAYSYLQAFKFPDRMEVQLECSLDICKRGCQQRSCGGNDDDGNGNDVSNDYRSGRQVTNRRRRDSLYVQRHQNRSHRSEQLILQKTLRVVSRDELAALRKVVDATSAPVNVSVPTPTAALSSTDVCLSLTHFVMCVVTVLSTAVAACVATAVACIRRASPFQRSSSVSTDYSRSRGKRFDSTPRHLTVKFPMPPSPKTKLSGTWPKIGVTSCE